MLWKWMHMDAQLKVVNAAVPVDTYYSCTACIDTLL